MGCRVVCFVFSVFLSFAVAFAQQMAGKERSRRCEYRADDGRRLEFILRDSFSAERLGYSLHIYKKEVGGMDSACVFVRDSLRSSYFICADDLPFAAQRVPRVVDGCGRRWLVFWAESHRTDAAMLYSRVHLLAIDVADGNAAEVVLEGHRIDAAVTPHARATERRFLVRSQRSETADSCMLDFLRKEVDGARFLTDYGSLPEGNPLNYAVDWERRNGASPLTDMRRVEFVSYPRPFAPMRPSRSVENGLFRVMAFPYGDILAYDKRRRHYLAVWASRYLPREDYSAALAWKEGSECELVLKGFYDNDTYFLNLETGEISKP